MATPAPIATAREVYRVEQIKYGVDADSPLWLRVFFRAAYLPFMRLAFKLGVPASGAMDVQGRFSWIEDIGTFTEWETADAMCHGEFWRIRKARLNVALPAESVQASVAVYPRAIKPDRERGMFPVAIAPVSQMAQVKRNLEQIIKSAAAT